MLRVFFRILGRRGLTALILLAVALAGGFYLGKGRVVQVPDGDTLVVLTDGGNFTRVRLYGVDCPESRQRDGPEAVEFSRNLVFLQPVTLKVMDTDQYDRAVALVRLADGRTLNEELVRAGHAWVYRRYCDAPFCAAWLDLERAARKQRLGLWRDKNPQPPWQWRRAHPR